MKNKNCNHLQMLQFLPFKSKSFISVYSLVNEKRRVQRNASILQTIKENKRYSEYKYIIWTVYNKSHREEKEDGLTLPAVIYTEGTQQWFRNGQCHRDDLDENGKTLPAIISSSRKCWFKNGQYHRSDRDEDNRLLPAYIGRCGIQYWYKNRQVHKMYMI